jgi:hypothetical protein
MMSVTDSFTIALETNGSKRKPAHKKMGRVKITRPAGQNGRSCLANSAAAQEQHSRATYRRQRHRARLGHRSDLEVINVEGFSCNAARVLGDTHPEIA